MGMGMHAQMTTAQLSEGNSGHKQMRQVQMQTNNHEPRDEYLTVTHGSSWSLPQIT